MTRYFDRDGNAVLFLAELLDCVTPALDKLDY